MNNEYNCPKCGRDSNNGLIIVCPCKQPLEDEWILALLNFMVMDLNLLPEKKLEIIDKTCVAITSYMRGHEIKGGNYGFFQSSSKNCRRKKKN